MSASRARQTQIVVDHDARLLVMFVELFVLEERLRVRDGIRALVAFVGRVEMQRQVLHVLAVFFLLHRVFQILGDVELKLSPTVVAIERDVELSGERVQRGGGRRGSGGCESGRRGG